MWQAHNTVNLRLASQQRAESSEGENLYKWSVSAQQHSCNFVAWSLARTGALRLTPTPADVLAGTPSRTPKVTPKHPFLNPVPGFPAMESTQGPTPEY